MLSEKDLVGVWRLVSHFYLADDGSTSEGPLGDEADGLLIYHEDGYMAVSMMRTKPRTSEDGSPPATYLGSADDYLAYSGRWQLRDGVIVHQVAIGSHPRVVNTEQVREVQLDDGCLSLRRRLDGPHRYVIMDWRRPE
jgi:hypothetical protein